MYETTHDRRSGQIHMPRTNKTHGILRDERFWAVVAIVLILALLVTLAVIAGRGTGGAPDYTPMYPYYP
jgi:hypothetical protein